MKMRASDVPNDMSKNAIESTKYECITRTYGTRLQNKDVNLIVCLIMYNKDVRYQIAK
jgi:hypothetical protein